MEDLSVSGGISLDQLKTIEKDKIEKIFNEMAKFHAKFWHKCSTLGETDTNTKNI